MTPAPKREFLVPFAPKRRWFQYWLLNTDIRDLFKKQGRLIDGAFLQELLGVLVKTDMGVESAQVIVDEVGATCRARVIRMEDLLASVKAKLKARIIPGR